MIEYIKKYPKEEYNAGTVVYSYGYEESERIFAEALKLNKRILIENDTDNLDGVSYSFY